MLSFLVIKKLKYFFITFCFLICGCVTTEYNVATHREDIYFFSTAKEIDMGQNMSKAVAEEYKISMNPYDIERVDKVAQKLRKIVDRKEISYYFYIIEEDDKGKPQVNAFCLPGGYIYIFKDLLDLLETDDELAYVLAHEMGHVVSRHHIKRLQAAMGYNFLMIASTQAPSDGQFRTGLSFALAQLMAGWSRQDELKADELAAKYCKLAGYDPAAGIDVLEKLYKENKKKIRPISYFKTHPYTADRIRNIKHTLKMPLSVDDYMNL